MPTAATTADAQLLSEDQIEELLYLSRTGELIEFQNFLSEVAESQHVRPAPIDLIPLVRDPASGNGILHMVSANGQIDVLNYIIDAFTSTSSTDPSHLNASPQPLSTMINTQNAAGNTPLHYAALNGQMAATKILLANGADASITNAAGKTAAHEAERTEKDDVAALLVAHGNVEEIATRDGGVSPVGELRGGSPIQRE